MPDPPVGESGPQSTVDERLVDEVRRQALQQVDSRLRNASQTACASSITLIWIRPTSGSLRPASDAAMARDSGGTGPEGT